MDEVLCRVEGAMGRITLNRPRALHALTTGMCAAMTEALLAWRADPQVAAVMIDHAGERGFCAGGDIRMLAESGAADGAAAREFFHTEYRLNHLLFGYPKPVIALMDGITMGGGVGISWPAKFRVATERTVFAMPETGIGLFPDVGGGWYLPRMPGKTGLWLALTGARLKAADCRALGLATHYVASERLEALKAALVAEPARVAETLDSFDADPGSAPIDEHRAEMDRLFSGPDVESIFAALAADGGAWAAGQLEVLRTKSPQTLKVAFRQLAEGAVRTDFAEEMQVEYRLGARIVQTHDFIEGVRAVIVEKDGAPRWNPPDLAGVGATLLDKMYAPLMSTPEWMPLPELRP